MAGSEKLCLRWNNFESNISDAFKELREEIDFYDVTLACDDSQVEAHKVILSACSPFFRNILKRNPHQHPLLYIKGVKYKDLLSMLNFMYLGEVNIVQDELNSFLAAAEELRIKGLTSNNSSSLSDAPIIEHIVEPSRQLSHPKEPAKQDQLPPSKRSRQTPTIQTTATHQLKTSFNDFTAEDNKIQEVKVELSSQAQGLTETVDVDDNFIVNDSYNYEPYYEDGEDLNIGTKDANKGEDRVQVSSPSELSFGLEIEPIVTIHHHSEENAIIEDEQGLETFNLDSTNCYADSIRDWDTEVSNKMYKQDNIWHCLECGHMNKRKKLVISHVQGKHLEEFGGYVCKLCGGRSGTYCGFEMHMYRKHKFCLSKKNIL